MEFCEWLRGPPNGPGVVETLSQNSVSGREAFPKVKK